MLKVKLNHPGAKLPTRSNGYAAGIDLYALYNCNIEPLGRKLVETGISIELPLGHCGLVIPRSGLALKQGVSIVNSPGLIDEDYRGDIGVILHNTLKSTSLPISTGDRIGQLLVIPYPSFEIKEVEELSDTERGSNGFGSSGK